MTVCIYDGFGASAKNAEILHHMFSMALHPFGIPVRMLGEQDLNNPRGQWQKDGSVLVFGGGEFTKVKEKLTPYGHAAIKDFVAAKRYLGACHGGYAGSAQIHFLGEDEEKFSPGFAFYNGIARGTLPVTPRPYNGQSTSASIVKLRRAGHDIEFPALYWGGPGFVDIPGIPSNAQPIVTLTDHRGCEHVVGLKVPMGAAGGKALLLSYHCEAIPEHARPWLAKFNDNHDDLVRLEKEIAAYPRWKFFLGFAHLLDDLEIVPRHSFVDKIMNPHHYDPRTARRIAPAAAGMPAP